jgi:hypothetical protein
MVYNDQNSPGIAIGGISVDVRPFVGSAPGVRYGTGVNPGAAIVLAPGQTCNDSALAHLANPACVLPAGTNVFSYMYHSKGGSDELRTLTLTFDYPVVGIILSNSHINNGLPRARRLDDTDAVLGAPTVTAYPRVGQLDRGLDAPNNVNPPRNDWVSYSADGRTVTINNYLANAVNYDEVRILTLTPEPGTVALFVITGLGLIAGIRRRNRVAA